MKPGVVWPACIVGLFALAYVPWERWPAILLVGVPVAWMGAMVVREWVHGRQHQRRIQLALVAERGGLEDRLKGIMTDAVLSAFEVDLDHSSPIHDDIATSVFDAELRSIEGPGDLGWGS